MQKSKGASAPPSLQLRALHLITAKANNPHSEDQCQLGGSPRDGRVHNSRRTASDQSISRLTQGVKENKTEAEVPVLDIDS